MHPGASNFGAYASFYDSLYQEKKYATECDFIEQQIRTYSNGKVRSILDLGCGTGQHARILAQRGYRVLGVDLSESMLQEARNKTAPELGIEYRQGNIASVRLSQKYDAVICMFAVISYLTENESLQGFFDTVTEHLNPGGILVTDFWYGPAVLRDPPQERVKSIPLDGSELVRYARGELHENENSVDVHYRILKLQQSQVLSDVRETHRMRYLFKPELDLFASRAGLTLELLSDFLNGDRPASVQTWCASAVFKKGESAPSVRTAP